MAGAGGRRRASPEAPAALAPDASCSPPNKELHKLGRRDRIVRHPRVASHRARCRQRGGSQLGSQAASQATSERACVLGTRQGMWDPPGGGGGAPSSVLPVPGGPHRSTPDGSLAPRRANTAEFFMQSTTWPEEGGWAVE